MRLLRSDGRAAGDRAYIPQGPWRELAGEQPDHCLQTLQPDQREPDSRGFGFPGIQAQAKRPLKDAAALNATRWKLWRVLSEIELPLEVGTGWRTKYNRCRQGVPKTHWLDAVCVGRTGGHVYVSSGMSVLGIKANGHGRRQMCLMDRYGNPHTKHKPSGAVFGFSTGDLVRAVVPCGKKAGAYEGRVAVRAS